MVNSSCPFVCFPSGNAFLLVDLQNHLEPFEESELIKRIDIFIQVHRNSFLLFYLPFSGKRGLQILSDIQCRWIEHVGFSNDLSCDPVCLVKLRWSGVHFNALFDWISVPLSDSFTQKSEFYLYETTMRSSMGCWQSLR